MPESGLRARAPGAGHAPGERAFLRRVETVATDPAEEIVMILSSDVDGGAHMVIDAPSPDEEGS